MKRLIDYLKQLFHKSVYLEESPGGYTLCIEKGFSAYFLYIPSASVLDAAKLLNSMKEFGLQYRLGIAGVERIDYIVVPRWAFVEVRRLITQKALELIKT